MKIIILLVSLFLVSSFHASAGILDNIIKVFKDIVKDDSSSGKQGKKTDQAPLNKNNWESLNGKYRIEMEVGLNWSGLENIMDWFDLEKTQLKVGKNKKISNKILNKYFESESAIKDFYKKTTDYNKKHSAPIISPHYSRILENRLATGKFARKDKKFLNKWWKKKNNKFKNKWVRWSKFPKELQAMMAADGPKGNHISKIGEDLILSDSAPKFMKGIVWKYDAKGILEFKHGAKKPITSVKKFKSDVLDFIKKAGLYDRLQNPSLLTKKIKSKYFKDKKVSGEIFFNYTVSSKDSKQNAPLTSLTREINDLYLTRKILKGKMASLFNGPDHAFSKSKKIEFRNPINSFDDDLNEKLNFFEMKEEKVLKILVDETTKNLKNGALSKLTDPVIAKKHTNFKVIKMLDSFVRYMDKEMIDALPEKNKIQYNKELNAIKKLSCLKTIK